MCGITGWIDWKKDVTHYPAIVEAMTETMAPRGPDAEGIWLSHTLCVRTSPAYPSSILRVERSRCIEVKAVEPSRSYIMGKSIMHVNLEQSFAVEGIALKQLVIQKLSSYHILNGELHLWKS